MPKSHKIYLDYAATTPVDPRVTKAMLPYFTDKFANSSSIHQLGREAKVAYNLAGEKTARFFKCQRDEIIFTSGATESNNLAIKGIVENLTTNGTKLKDIEIVTSAIEHHSVLEPLSYLGKRGVKVKYVQPNRQGIITVNKVKSSLTEKTRLVSVMYINNEIGTIQPIAAIGRMIGEKNKQRKYPIIFHTDAVQAVNYFDCSVNRLKVDLMSISAHKIYGPKGVGILFKKQGIELDPIVHGGSQENGLRAGTTNVPLIIGMTKALEIVKKEQSTNFKKVRILRDELLKRIRKDIKGIEINGDMKQRTPNNLNVSFQGIEGESLLALLDVQGIAVSTGSACSSDTLDPSHVIIAISNDHLRSHASIRFSLGKNTTVYEIKKTAHAIIRAVINLRKISSII